MQSMETYVVKKKRKGCKSLKRAAACSENAARQHIDELAEVGIMTEPVKIENGVSTLQE